MVLTHLTIPIILSLLENLKPLSMEKDSPTSWSTIQFKNLNRWARKLGHGLCQKQNLILIRAKLEKVMTILRLEILSMVFTSGFSIFSDTVCHDDIYDILEKPRSKLKRWIFSLVSVQSPVHKIRWWPNLIKTWGVCKDESCDEKPHFNQRR